MEAQHHCPNSVRKLLYVNENSNCAELSQPAVVHVHKYQQGWAILKKKRQSKSD